MKELFTPFIPGTPVKCLSMASEHFGQEGIVSVNDLSDNTVRVEFEDNWGWIDVAHISITSDDMDWVREGDTVISQSNEEKLCIGRAGQIVFLAAPTSTSYLTFTISSLKKAGYKVKRSLPEPNKTTLSMDEIAAKFNIPVDQLQIKKD